MRYSTYIFSFVALSTVLACGGGGNDDLAAKQQRLGELQKQEAALKKEMQALQAEIAALDTTAPAARTVLVTTRPVERKKFAHFVEVRGSVESNRNINLSAEANGMIERVPVQEGQMVRRGQTLMQIDAAIQRNQIAELDSRLSLARTLYEKREGLWEQGIGTEVQYLEAKNNVEALEKQLATLRTQTGKATVRAPFDGVVDAILMREGEMAAPGAPLIRLVSLDQVYVQADVSERYLGQIERGAEARVRFPSLGTEKTGKVRAVSQVIKTDNRTFSIEIDIENKSGQLRPKMLAVAQMKDFEEAEAIVIPTNLIQQRRDQNFVYVLDKAGQTAMARRVNVEKGRTYQAETVITEGLRGDEILIDEGSREVSDSTLVQVTQLRNLSLNN